MSLIHKLDYLMYQLMNMTYSHYQFRLLQYPLEYLEIQMNQQDMMYLQYQYFEL